MRNATSARNLHRGKTERQMLFRWSPIVNTMKGNCQASFARVNSTLQTLICESAENETS